MPSFDFSSKVNIDALKNAIDLAGKKIIGRHDFKGTSAKVELNEKEKLITLWGDSEFQLNQIKEILFPAMEGKEPESTKRLDPQKVEPVSGNKAKQVLKLKDGIDSELAKKIVRLIKDAKLKAQASIQGDVVRVSGKKIDELREAITLVRSKITDFPIKDDNYRD
ncbi:MAG: YajQ family cyclic di-GMP-binding protein [Rhodocyclaceae bacterium]|nr:YajQ family cyclic di-GMP-binding protein [Rhodocyclaceae bacterium]